MDADGLQEGPALPEKNDLKEAWKKISKEIRARLGASTYRLFFTEAKLRQVADEVALIRTAGAMYAIWIEENFRES
ncbi:MAG: DnaA N-terminal domain-containing protein, partial [Verrucomicrobiota bacterium]